MPDPLHPLELRRLLVLAKKDRRSLEEVRYAFDSVTNWWLSRQQRRGDWVAVIVRSMSEGWGLRGFKRFQERNPTHSQINARTGEVFGRKTKLEDGLIDAVVRRHCERHGLELPIESDPGQGVLL